MNDEQVSKSARFGLRPPLVSNSASQHFSKQKADLLTSCLAKPGGVLTS
jgi:hypothetical protein